MFQGKPIIGIAGGIGSGKSHVAQLFAQLGCLVINADDLVRDAYNSPHVQATLRQWWGGDVLKPDGTVDRAAIAAKVFNHPDQLQRLEQLLHPLVAARRDELMRLSATDPAIKAFVWDIPLLFEVGLNRLCDAVVFVDAPLDIRLQRVAEKRGWDRDELEKREKCQLPLDKKRVISDYSVRNASDADDIRGQVLEVLSRILAGLSTN